MSEQVREELQWRIINLNLTHGNYLVTAKLQVKIPSDVFIKSLRAFCLEHRTAKPWSKLKGKKYLNASELGATKFDVVSFTKMLLDVKVNDSQMDNTAVLTYIKPMEDTNKGSFQIWPGKFGII